MAGITSTGHFSRVYPSYSMPGYENVRTPHNTYFNLITGWGMLGGLLFFGWIAWWWFGDVSGEGYHRCKEIIVHDPGSRLLDTRAV